MLDTRIVRIMSVLAATACTYADPGPYQHLVSSEPPSAGVYIPVGSYPGTVDVPIVASAPPWVTDERYLGQLFDDSFHPLPNSQIRVTTRAYLDTDVERACVEFSSAQAFRATVSADVGFDIGPWGVGVGVSDSTYAAQYRRFLHCRSIRHERTVEAQPDIDLSWVGPDAVYVLTKMEFGSSDERIAENIASLSQKDFQISANAEFDYLLKAGVGHGTSDASFQSSVRWYERRRGGGVYRTSMPTEMPRPVLVEYRQLCGPPGCTSPGRYGISDFPLQFSPLDQAHKPWDSNGTGLDLVLSLYVDGQFVGVNCSHEDILHDEYNCAPDLRNAVVLLRDKHSTLQFDAIDDDGDGAYTPAHPHDPVGQGFLDLVVGTRPGSPLMFRTSGAIESASITLRPL